MYFVVLKIYDINGREIINLLESYKSSGEYRINWNGKNEKGIPVAGGLYFYSIRSGEFRETKKMIFLK